MVLVFRQSFENRSNEKPTFGVHVSEICKRVSKHVGVLNRSKNPIPTRAKLQLFKAAIIPHLTYCHLVWHFSRAFDWRKLERLQKRALRAVFNDAMVHMEHYSKTLYNRRLQNILILMYKVKNGLTPTYLTHLFQVNCREEGRYHLRNSDFRLPCYRTVTHGKHSIGYLRPSPWGKLTKKERTIKSVTEFRGMIRKKDLSAGVDGCRTSCYICTTLCTYIK